MDFHTIVCIKSVLMDVPDGPPVRHPEKCILNPFDVPALSMALHIREKRGGTVTAVSMGPEGASLALYEALAMGVDRALLVSDPTFSGADTLATSTTLGAVILKLSPWDLVLFGTRSTDSDTGQVGPQTAVNLERPFLSGVTALEGEGKTLSVWRRTDAFVEQYEISLPCALTIHPSAFPAQDATLLGIETAFRDKDIERLGLKDIDLSPGAVGEKGSQTRVVSMARADRSRACTFITGSIEEQADELIRRLRRLDLIADPLIGS